jgi:Fe-S oxidoreductase
MATYKAEFLAHYFKRHWRPRSAWSMGRIQEVARWVRLAPSVANFFAQTPGLSAVAKRVAGVHPKRKLPVFAKHPFHQSARVSSAAARHGDVLLWVDTFNNFFHPEIAQSAVSVLEAAGFRVRLTRENICCGRPLYDFGFLDQARRHLSAILHELAWAARAGTPIVFLEPSCASVLHDEMTGIFPTHPDALRLARQTVMLGEFLVKKAPDFKWPQVTRKALVHGHCHHKSVLNFDCERQAYMKMGLDFEVLDSGCCGMAGAFGFEREHYDVSQAAGERVLFPRVREAAPENLVMADGFSCREQILQGTGVRARHLAEILAEGFAGQGLK